MTKKQKENWRKSIKNTEWGKHGFKKGNRTRSQFKKGHIPWCAGKKLNSDFCKKVTLGKLESNYTHSVETKQKMRLKKVGKKHWNYVDGRSLFKYSSQFNKEIKEIIKKRDKYKCKWFDSTDNCNKKLTIHHIDYNKQNNTEKNLITLCLRHNVRANYNRKNCIKQFNKYIKQIYE